MHRGSRRRGCRPAVRTRRRRVAPDRIHGRGTARQSTLQRGTAALAGALVLLAVALSGCLGRPTSPANHHATLAEGETAAIASQLTPVPGYRYFDTSKLELWNALAKLRKRSASSGGETPWISRHSVAASDPTQNTAEGGGSHETAVLQMFEWAHPGRVPAYPDLSHENIGHVGQEIVGGTTVSGFVNPAAPNGKYAYAWVRHGLLTYFDGATRPATEK